MLLMLQVWLYAGVQRVGGANSRREACLLHLWALGRAGAEMEPRVHDCTFTFHPQLFDFDVQVWCCAVLFCFCYGQGSGADTGPFSAAAQVSV